jgi:hypothetical protein
MTVGDTQHDLIGRGGSISLASWDGIPGGVIAATAGTISAVGAFTTTCDGHPSERLRPRFPFNFSRFFNPLAPVS